MLGVKTAALDKLPSSISATEHARTTLFDVATINLEVRPGHGNVRRTLSVFHLKGADGGLSGMNFGREISCAQFHYLRVVVFCFGLRAVFTLAHAFGFGVLAGSVITKSSAIFTHPSTVLELNVPPVTRM